MTKKKDESLTRSQALSLSWRNRKNYKGYDKSVGSLFNTWRAIVYSKKRKMIGFPEGWRSFENFKTDVGEGWERGKILCRKDTQKQYSKDNCEWRDKGEENFGKLAILEYNGESKTLVEWCDELALNYNGVRQRYFKGKNYTSEQILFGKNLRMSRFIKDINEITDEQIKRNKVSSMLSAYRHKDRVRKLDFDIDREWFFDQISHGNCFYCGDTERLGLDRIDNHKGHTMDNVVVCCYDCNIARGNNFTHDEMLEIGEAIRIIKSKRNENNKRRIEK